MKEKKYKNIKRKQCPARRFLAGLFLLFLTVGMTSYLAWYMSEERASAYTTTVNYGDYQVVLTPSGDVVFQFFSLKDADGSTTFYLDGTHNYVTDRSEYISYKTVGFTMSDVPTTDYGTFGNVAGIPSSHKYEITTSGTILTDKETLEQYSEYPIKADKFIGYVLELYDTQSERQQLATTGLPVYLHSIYDVGKKVIADGWTTWTKIFTPPNVKNLDDIVDYGSHQNPSWSWTDETKDNFQYYYDMKFTIKLTPYTTTVNYIEVDSTGKEIGVIKSAVETRDFQFYYGEYNYTLDSDTITVNGKNYTYADKATIDYGDGEVSLGNSTTVNWTHSEQADAEINFYFTADKVTVPVNVLLKYYVKSSTDTDYTWKEDVPLASAATKGSSYSWTAKPSVTFSGITYNYELKWNYYYEDPDYGTMYTSNVSTDYPYIKLVPEVAEGTALTIRLYYSTEAEEVTTTPTPVPSTTPVPTVTPVENEEIPAYQLIKKEITIGTRVGKINGNTWDDIWYFSNSAIPTQESQYGQVETAVYLLGYELEKVVGQYFYSIPVTRTYTLQWQYDTGETDPDTGEPVYEQKEEEVIASTMITVQRAYGYWEINSFAFYTVDSATLYNATLPGGSVTLGTNASYNAVVPAVSTSDLDTSMNLVAPSQVKDGIELEPVTITSDTQTKPLVPTEEFKVEAYDTAQEETDEIQVRNDSLYFNGVTIMNSAVMDYDTGDIDNSAAHQSFYNTSKDMVYGDGYVIDATFQNITYPSSGTVTYKLMNGVSIATAQQSLSYALNSVNSVAIHTPVYCDGTITGDNDAYVQLAEEEIDEDAVQLVLDSENELNDFTVHISNYGQHVQEFGYFTRDFSKILRNTSLSNIMTDPATGLLCNEVKFGFDCYMDVSNDDNEANDKYIPAGTWTVIGTSDQRFYVGMTVKEGIYTADMRTIAVNAFSPYEMFYEDTVNLDRSNYVATDSSTLQVSGRMFGLSIYDISDYPLWEEIFRPTGTLYLKRDLEGYKDGTVYSSYYKDFFYDYTVGTKDSYGNETGRLSRFTFPLVDGSHPCYTNTGIIKKGYSVRFTLDTIGSYFEDGSKITVDNTFYWVDEDGNNRTEVDLYYTKEIDNQSIALIRAGNAQDTENFEKYMTGNRYLGIPITELRATAALRNTTYTKWKQQYTDLFCIAQVLLTSPFRTYTNQTYAKRVESLGFLDELEKENIDSDAISRLRQSWYGTLYVPGNAYICPKGTKVYTYAHQNGIDYTEDFWLNDGYIIVNVTITVTNSDGEQVLYYVNPDDSDTYCSMWELEGAKTQKTGTDGVVFKLEPGDFVIYSNSESAMDDYVSEGIY